MLSKGLAKWNALPEAERAPGMKLDDLGPVDSDLDLAPPPGGLVLKVFIRSLSRDSKGSLYVPAKMDLDNAGAIAIDAQAQRDHFWMTASEANSLLSLRPGKEPAPAPDFLGERIFRYYLKDSATCIPGTAAAQFGGYTGTLNVMAGVSTPSLVQIRLQGAAKGKGPDFQVFGRIDIDPAKKTFTQFRLLAYSEAGHVDKKTSCSLPLGVAFELCPGERAQDRVPPYFFTLDRWDIDPKKRMEAYFGARN